MAVIAVMKKDEARRFELTNFVGSGADAVITMAEIDLKGESITEPKEVKRKTFTKGYKLVEGSLDDIRGEAPPAPEAGATKLIDSVDRKKATGREIWLVTAYLVDPEADIVGINEADFITELVNDHGVRHGDKIFLMDDALGHVNLNGKEPQFDMLNPPLLDETKATDSNDEMITFTYVESGRKVTMTRREFFASTVAVTAKEKPLQEDPLPNFEEESRPSPIAWNTTPTADMQTALPDHGQVVVAPTPWALTPSDEKPQDPYMQADQEAVRNSMRANREAKIDDAKPFIPEPFFLRQSMISSYLQCPDKMYDTYENGYNEESIFTRVGTAIHGVMEDYYNDNTIDIPEAFDKWWAEHAVPEWDWYRDWREFVTKYFDRQAKYEAPKVIATELEFQTIINGVPVSGTIDRVDRVDERTIRLVDYKTNFKAFTDSELAESIQFMMYTSAIKTEEVRQLLRDRGDSGEFEVVLCTYEMLRLGYRQETMFGLEELGVFEEWLATVWTMILSGYNRKPKLNQYCGYCQKRQRCDLYLEALNAPVSSILTENTDIAEIIEERDRLSENAKLIKNRLSEIEEQIKAKIAENEGTMVVGEYEWGLKAGTRNVYPAQDVFRILAMNGLGDVIPDLVSISKTSLERKLKDRKDVLELIDAKKQLTFIAPSLGKKKIKPVKGKK